MLLQRLALQNSRQEQIVGENQLEIKNGRIKREMCG